MSKPSLDMGGSQIDAYYSSTNVTATFFASYLTRQKKSSNIFLFILCPKASGANRLPPVF